MGTYGDRGNARVLERRLAWRDLPGEVVEIGPGEGVLTEKLAELFSETHGVPPSVTAQRRRLHS